MVKIFFEFVKFCFKCYTQTLFITTNTRKNHFKFCKQCDAFNLVFNYSWLSLITPIKSKQDHSINPVYISENTTVRKWNLMIFII